MDVAAYIRVSSKAQDYTMQKHAIGSSARSRGDTVCYEYSEKQSSKTMNRPELERLRADIRAGRIRRLYAYRLDRFCRTGIRDTFDFIQECRDHRCEIVTCADGFDLNSPMADVIVAVMAWAAQMERLTINERIAGARAAMESKGQKWGRPSRLTDSDRKKIQSLRDDGLSIREIAQHVRVPRATVARALASQKDVGPGPMDSPSLEDFIAGNRGPSR